jgi:hypothetical protein
MPAMKRPGKPDTGNPFVRFDEGRGWIRRELTTTVRLIPFSHLRLLYLRSAGSGEPAQKNAIHERFP